MKPRLERWVQHGDVFCGYIFDDKKFDPGTRVITGAIVEHDPISCTVRCVGGDFKLGEPGTVEEHNQPLLGHRKDL